MRILIAEDEKALRMLLERSLQKWGWEVEAYPNGSLALEALQRQDAPDMALLDWNMPGMEGPDICRALRADGSNQYIILLTNKGSKDSVVEGLEAGADDYVVKPWNQPELRARLRAGKRIVTLTNKLEERSLVDELTGIPNRRSLNDMLHKEWNRMLRAGESLGLLMIDIDYFKKYNDLYGHPEGDACLQQVARALKENLRRAGDFVARYGGEEFCVLLPGCKADDAHQAGEKLCKSVRNLNLEHKEGRSKDGIVSISVGAAVMNATEDNKPETLLQNADEALYQAKERGGDQVFIEKTNGSTETGSS